MSIFSKSYFVWSPEAGTARNGFVSFEQRFVKPDEAPLTLHLFADTRFRLWVNEVFVAYGPARFLTAHPEYDSYELSPFLIEGENLVRVEVNFYGSSSYQTVRDGMPGFIAAGTSKSASVTFETPGTWTAKVHKAWSSNAPSFSFAQNPAEICDTRILADELKDVEASIPLDVLEDEASPWGVLQPRSAPYPTYPIRRPELITVAAPLKNERLLWGVQTFIENFKTESAPSKRYRALTSWLYSPRKQTIELDCFWSNLYLNGEELEVNIDTPLGNHGFVELILNEGWNFLSLRFELLLESWSYLLGVPEAAGVSLHARPDKTCSDVFALSPLEDWDPEFSKANVAPEGYNLPPEWGVHTGEIKELTPARVMAWDAPDEAFAKRNLPMADLSEVATFKEKGATWGFNFKLEYFGQPVLVVNAPAGTILDVAYDDWLRKDGSVCLYASNPFVDAADRFILKGGRQQIDVLNPRGGIYMQVTMRVPAGESPADLSLCDIFVRQRTTIEQAEGSLHTGESVFDWIWDRAVNTLIASTDEAYSDCPWRERASYIGDAVVGVNLDAMVVSDLSVARRTFRTFGQAALPCGGLQGCAPSWGGDNQKPLEDFTHLWIIGLHDYWALTGDTSALEENWSALRGIWKPRFDCHASGLWAAPEGSVFIDTEILIEERHGEANAALNFLRIGALRTSAKLAQVLGKTAEAESFKREAIEVEGAAMEYLWLSDEGRFAPSLEGRTKALHANVWALCFGVGPSEQIIAYLEPFLRKNLNEGLTNPDKGGYIELYFLFYLLPALAEAGREDLAEQLIEDHYGYLQPLGHLTLNEFFCRAHLEHGSCCHTWSGAGAIYGHRYVLGLRQVEAGNMDLWVLDPIVTERFTSVEGVYPHPKGSIEIRWERKGERILADISSPEGVVVQLAEGLFTQAEH